MLTVWTTRITTVERIPRINMDFGKVLVGTNQAVQLQASRNAQQYQPIMIMKITWVRVSIVIIVILIAIIRNSNT